MYVEYYSKAKLSKYFLIYTILVYENSVVRNRKDLSMSYVSGVGNFRV